MAPRFVNLSDRINPWFLETNGVVFLHRNGVEVAVQMFLPDEASMSEADVGAVFRAYYTILQQFNIPNGRIRTMVFNRPATRAELMTVKTPRSDDPLRNAMIDEERKVMEAKQRAGEIRIHETFMLMHIPDTRSGVRKSDDRSYSDEDHAQAVMRALEVRDRVLHTLTRAGIAASPVMHDDPYRMMWRYYNFGYIGDEIPPYDWDYEMPDVTRAELLANKNIRPRTLRAQVINSDIPAEDADYLRNGGAKIVVADMINYGELMAAGSADRIMSELNGFDYMYVVDAHFSNEARIKSKINRNMASARRQAEESGGMEDIARSSKMTGEQMAGYVDESRFLLFGVSMIVAARTDEEVVSVRNTIRNAWNIAGEHIMSFGAHTNWDQFIYALAPYSGQSSDFLNEHKASEIPLFFPYFGPWNNVGGVTLGVFENTYGGQQRITLPRTNEAAQHMGFTGASGSGKSFTLMKLLMGMYMSGDILRIIDIKNDYEPFIRWVGGQIIDCKPGAVFESETVGPHGDIQPPGTRICFNIFERKDVTDANPEMTLDGIADIVGFLRALIPQPLNSRESTLLSGAVTAFVNAQHGDRPIMVDGVRVMRRVYNGSDLATFVRYFKGVTRLGDFGLEGISDFKQIAQELGLILNGFVQGVYGSLLQGNMTINPRSDVTQFNLFSVGQDTNKSMLGAMTTIINKMTVDEASKRKDYSRRVVLVSEESGVTGKIPEIKSMVNRIALTGRAWNLMLILVVQNFQHLVDLEDVLNNINRFVMGKCSAEEAQILGERLKLTPEQEVVLTTLGREAGVYNELAVREVKPNGSIQFGKIIYRPTAMEYGMFSSDPSDKNRREVILKEVGGDMRKAILRLAAG